MTPVTVTASRLADGSAVPFAGVTGLSVTASLASPAVSMTCGLAVDQFPGELGNVAVYQGARLLFSGKIDRQTASVSGRGRLLSLEARSRGALLLDNEALPCALSNVRLSTVFNLVAAPYGFRLLQPWESGTLALYTIHKGLSEWEALTGYTRRVYGIAPWVRGEEIVVGPPRSGAMLTLGEGGIPFLSLEQILTPYEILSQVVLRDLDGNYHSAVQNSAADYYGVRRKRYVIPANEFMDNLALDANQRIRRSMLAKERVRVTVPGLVEAEPGGEARVLDSGLVIHGLLMEERTWRIDKSGVTTSLELIKSQYYDSGLPAGGAKY